MNREEIIQILNKYAVDLFAHGLRYGYETNTPLLEKIADEIVSSLPPAEGAEEILTKHLGSLMPLKYGVKYNKMTDAMREFATLHAQRIAEKMVSERCKNCKHRGLPDSINEALNSGDGVYRP